MESLSCGTPIIVTLTGGLQDQISDGETTFGVGLTPASKAIIGSQQVPYIFEDRVSKEDFLDALIKIYEMSAEERETLGAQARVWAQDEFGFEKFIQRWDDLFTHVVDTQGSWDTRQGYTPYKIRTF